mmetsp:Transcript_24290/g.50661  ORF Transcript_24290/g.50661 Transcript_24290/m.50661 type:complete len:424 (-) Transcript_24290:296-1567(-)
MLDDCGVGCVKSVEPFGAIGRVCRLGLGALDLDDPVRVLHRNLAALIGGKGCKPNSGLEAGLLDRRSQPFHPGREQPGLQGVPIAPGRHVAVVHNNHIGIKAVLARLQLLQVIDDDIFRYLLVVVVPAAPTNRERLGGRILRLVVGPKGVEVIRHDFVLVIMRLEKLEPAKVRRGWGCCSHDDAVVRGVYSNKFEIPVSGDEGEVGLLRQHPENKGRTTGAIDQGRLTMATVGAVSVGCDGCKAVTAIPSHIFAQPSVRSLRRRSLPASVELSGKNVGKGVSRLSLSLGRSTRKSPTLPTARVNVSRQLWVVGVVIRGGHEGTSEESGSVENHLGRGGYGRRGGVGDDRLGLRLDPGNLPNERTRDWQCHKSKDHLGKEAKNGTRQGKLDKVDLPETFHVNLPQICGVRDVLACPYLLQDLVG